MYIDRQCLISYVHILCSKLDIAYLVCHHTANSFNILPLFSLSSCLSLQESTSIVLKGSSASSLRGASKFLVNKKVDEYALLSKDGGPPGGGGGDNKGSGHGGPPSGGPGGGGDGKHFILYLYGIVSSILYPISNFITHHFVSFRPRWR